MLARQTLIASDTVAYQTGQFFGQLALFVIGLCLLLSGLQDRRADGKRDGVVKISFGAGFLILLVFSLVTAVAAP